MVKFRQSSFGKEKSKGESIYDAVSYTHLLCPGTGQSGFEGFGRVVSGEVSPSGRTADTYVEDLTASPWWNNFGDFKYTNTEEINSNASGFDPAGACHLNTSSGVCGLIRRNAKNLTKS